MGMGTLNVAGTNAFGGSIAKSSYLNFKFAPTGQDAITYKMTEYNGNFGDSYIQGYINKTLGTYWVKLLKSGVLYPINSTTAVNIFMVGGGGGGNGTGWNDSVPQITGGAGGAGGCRRTGQIALERNASYPIIIGAGGIPAFGYTKAGNGGTTSAFDITAPGGGGASDSGAGTNRDGTGTGGSGGWTVSTGSVGADGGYAYDDSTFDGYRYGAGGGGINRSGGADGGGYGNGSVGYGRPTTLADVLPSSADGSPNSGSGGGAGHKPGLPWQSGGDTWGGYGGSGVVIIRNW